MTDNIQPNIQPNNHLYYFDIVYVNKSKKLRKDRKEKLKKLKLL